VSCTNYEFISASSSWTEDSEILQIEQGISEPKEFTTLANALRNLVGIPNQIHRC
jgi:hypothetical protein